MCIELGTMVSSWGGLIVGEAHRISKVLVNVLFLKVRDEFKGISFITKTLPLS